MSSRALRRLQKDSGILGDLPPVDGEEVGDDSENVDGNHNIGAAKLKNKKKKKKAAAPVNPFELLDNGADDPSLPSDEGADSDGEADKPATITEKPTVKTKKKKKSKKKQKGNDVNTDAVVNENAVDEVEASLQEVNRILGDAGVTLVQSDRDGKTSVASMKSLLHIDHRNLNPETELKRMFGSQVVRGEQQQERSHRRHRNRPVQRSSRLVQPKDTWHPTGGSGLSMKYLGNEDGFAFEHLPAYQRMQFEFCDAVESGHPEAIVNVLRKHPYHIDSLFQMSEFHRINEDFQTAAEFIEKAIYGMECAFHPMFNIAAANCYLPYNRPENRPMYLCIFKHILNMGRRGCNRTAFEFCKLLMSLDPVSDPLDCMYMIDFFALRSEQFDYLLRLETEVPDAHRGVVNFSFSIALAHFKDAMKRGADTTTADERLQEALLHFPVLLMPLLDQCCVQPDKRVSSHAFFNSKELLECTSELPRLVTLYVKRCESCWKEAEVMSWLERNVLAVLDIVDAGTDKRIHEYAAARKKGFHKPPLSLLRHYILSEIQGVAPPQRFTSGAVLSYDPFPPPGSIVSYTRPARPTAASQNDSGFLRSFLDSLRPSYNPNEVPGQRNQMPAMNDLEAADLGGDEDGAVGGGGAIPMPIQDGVNYLMEAMRQLLNDPLAPIGQGQEGEGDNEGAREEEDGGWDDEEELPDHR